MNIAPRSVRRLVRSGIQNLKGVRYGVIELGPQYWIHKKVRRHGVVADCGVGDHPDFSLALIERFGARCHAFDPTRKHQASLARFAAQSVGNLLVHPCAIAPRAGRQTFFESAENVSGSLLEDHVNVRNDSRRPYEVEAVTVENIFQRLGVTHLDVLKLDIEGAEYEVLDSIPDETFSRIGQLVVEFHHYCLKRFTIEDTRQRVDRLERFGFKAFTHDRKTYLFFRR